MANNEFEWRLKTYQVDRILPGGRGVFDGSPPDAENAENTVDEIGW
jgi:hypothetical protein